MTALVTGGHGFVGSHLVRLLLAEGRRVRCLLRRPGRPPSLSGLDVDIVRGDIRDPASLPQALRGVREVYHLAALTRSRTRGEIVATNARGTGHLLAAAVRARLPGRFVLCSSLAAVGPAREGRPLDEGSPCRPVTWYGESKLLAEEEARAVADRLPVTILRPPAVYGPRDRDLLAVFRATRRGILPVLGTRPRTYQFVYVKDLARGLLAAARAPEAAGRTYFVAHDEVLTTEAFARTVAQAVGRPDARRVRIPDALLRLMADGSELVAQWTGKPPLLNRQRMRELAPLAYLCSADAIRRDLGFVAATAAREGTLETAAWYGEEGWL